mmetsp:Transcript_121191/g.328900  ORF Transcript_121191/g.328900 Transcript_121191/m.328900 type:complete len:256 (+) Transcript_121191:296-1063(+)
MAPDRSGDERQGAGPREPHASPEGDPQLQDPRDQVAGGERRQREREGRLRLHAAARGVLHREHGRGELPPQRQGERRRSQQKRLHPAAGLGPGGPHRRLRVAAPSQRGRGRRGRQGLDAPAGVCWRGPHGGLPGPAPVPSQPAWIYGGRALRAQRAAGSGRAGSRGRGEAAAGSPRRPPPQLRRRHPAGHRLRAGGAEWALEGADVAHEPGHVRAASRDAASFIPRTVAPQLRGRWMSRQRVADLARRGASGRCW